MKFPFLAAVTSLVAAVSCGGSKPQTVQQTAQAERPKQTPALPPKVVKPIDFELLKGMLPEIAGWSRQSPRGEELTAPVPFSRADARYEDGDRSIEVVIVDSSFHQLLIAPVAMFVAAGYAERSNEGYRKATSISGSPGFEDWSTRSNRGEVCVIVANRFIITATGHNLANINPVRKAVEAVDLTRLASLK